MDKETFLDLLKWCLSKIDLEKNQSLVKELNSIIVKYKSKDKKDSELQLNPTEQSITNLEDNIERKEDSQNQINALDQLKQETARINSASLDLKRINEEITNQEQIEKIQKELQDFNGKSN